MPRLYAALVIAIVAIVVIFAMIVIWGKRAEAPAAAAESSMPVPAAPGPVPDPTSLTPKSDSSAIATPTADAESAASTKILGATQALIRECLSKDPTLPRVNYTENFRFEDLLNDLRGRAAPEVSTETMNVHVAKPDGREIRLHVQPYDSDMKASPLRYKLGEQDVRVYDVDSEGLPIAIDYPGDLRRESIKSVITDFAAGGRVTFRERRLHEKLGGDRSVDLVETDGRITEAQLYFGQRSLGCALESGQMTCRCLSQK